MISGSPGEFCAPLLSQPKHRSLLSSAPIVVLVLTVLSVGWKPAHQAPVVQLSSRQGPERGRKARFLFSQVPSLYYSGPYKFLGDWICILSAATGSLSALFPAIKLTLAVTIYMISFRAAHLARMYRCTTIRKGTRVSAYQISSREGAKSLVKDNILLTEQK